MYSNITVATITSLGLARIYAMYKEHKINLLMRYPVYVQMH